jgi:uncharacterized protein YndB with AHSA1/START domain
MTSDVITITATINAPIERVWACWNEPEHIAGWCFASPDWEAVPGANDLRAGGRFSTRMQAKDGSFGFDFGGTYSAVEPQRLLEYTMDGVDGIGDAGRRVRVEFEQTPEGVRITEAFEPEGTNPAEMQRAGWQAILDNFKRYAEQG